MVWNVSPEIFNLGPLSLRYYGLLFLAGFLIGYKIVEWIFKNEKVSTKLLEPLFIYIFVGTLVGARLGHVLFYEPELFLGDPLRIFKIWEGGLGSHGGLIGVILGMYMFTKKHKVPGFLWLLDRNAIPGALAAGLIRIGNFFNSEILGKPADVPWAVTFVRVDSVPRHPAQLYEAFGYLATFGILLFLYLKKKNLRKAHGFFVGLMLVLMFTWRFFIEFLKEHQVEFEKNLPLDMGQLLSIPFIIIGIVLILRSRRHVS